MKNYIYLNGKKIELSEENLSIIFNSLKKNIEELKKVVKGGK